MLAKLISLFCSLGQNTENAGCVVGFYYQPEPPTEE